jgi:hypothetical protein
VADTAKGAALPLETANASGAPTVDEQVAVLAAHMVAQETASLNEQLDVVKAERDALKTENAGLKDKVEVAEAAKAAADQAFEDYKADQAAKVEQAKLADARKAEVAKVAPTLVEGEEAKVAERVERWTSMDEAAFTSYVAELASVAGKSVESGKEGFTPEAGETAMQRGKKTATATTGKSAATAVLGLS